MAAARVITGPRVPAAAEHFGPWVRERSFRAGEVLVMPAKNLALEACLEVG